MNILYLQLIPQTTEQNIVILKHNIRTI